jgi:hypothetical protein
MLRVKRGRLYELRKNWLLCSVGKKPFKLSSRRESASHRLPSEEVQRLHEELDFIRRKAVVYRGRFNFAALAEETKKTIGHPFHRATLRAFALRHGYYHGLLEEKK